MNRSDAQPPANYVTCRCQHCDGGIEFDANNLEEGETRVVPCPHCGKETILDAVTNFSTEEIPDDSAELENMYSHRVYVHSIRELIEIARQFADKLDIEIDDGALELIARLSVGSPTDLLKLLRLVKDFSKENASAKKWITTDLAEKALKPLLEERAKLASEESRKLLSAAEVSQLNNLTPGLFSDFIGQKRVKARLEIAVAAAKKRREALDHILLTGPPGLGKATLAIILANAMGTNAKSTSGTAIEQAGDLAGLLTNLEEGDILFIDEIHCLRKTIAEYLNPAMKDFKLDIVIDQGENARGVSLNLPRFTLIGTTPRKERLPTALLSCFTRVENMDAYSVEELAAIACRFAKLLEFEIDEGAADRIARSADGTPLDVLRRLRHVRDFAHVKGSSEKITADITAEALKMLLPADEAREASDSRDAIPSEVRREVWRRDGGKCVKCGSRANLEYDHIIPVSKGGSNTARNIELLCEICNRSKRDSIQ